MAYASPTSQQHVVTRMLHQALWLFVMGLWMGLHLLIAVMVVLVSSAGRAARWAGGWSGDLGMGMEYEEFEEKRKTNRLWPVEKERADEL